MPVAGNIFLLHWTNTSDKPDISVVPGNVDGASTSLTLLGQGTGDWGEATQQNLLRVLENFSNTSSPPNPTKGQLWWKSDTNELKVYNGTTWDSISKAVIAASASAPANANDGYLWYETDTNWLWIWNGSGWSQVYSTNSMPASSAPSSPQNGQLWLDTVNNQLKAWNASLSSWYTIGPVTFTQSFIAVAVSLPTTFNDAVALGNWSLTNGAHNLVIGVTIEASNVSASKCYELTTFWNHTAGAWKIVEPTYESPVYASNNFMLEAMQTNAVLHLRLRRAGGADPVSANIYMQNIGYSTDIWTAVAPTVTNEPPHPSTNTINQINKRALAPGGTPDATTFLRGDGVWATPPEPASPSTNLISYFMAGW